YQRLHVPAETEFDCVERRARLGNLGRKGLRSPAESQIVIVSGTLLESNRRLAIDRRRFLCKDKQSRNQDPGAKKYPKQSIHTVALPSHGAVGYVAMRNQRVGGRNAGGQSL